jgi:hypothetical protein
MMLRMLAEESPCRSCLATAREETGSPAEMKV